MTGGQVKPMRPDCKNTSVETLRVRYAELLRLREYVQQLECAETAKQKGRRAIGQYDFVDRRRVGSACRH